MTKTQRDWLIKNNLDPEIYDIDAEGNVSENPIMGKLEAGARSAAVSVAPSLTAIPAAMAGGEGGALLGAPFGPLGILVGGAVGALGAGAAAAYGTSKAQEALLERYSPETLQKLSQAQEEQPVSSYVGGFLPTALTARPSLKGLSELGRPLTRQTTLREALTKPAFVEPAMNVTANVAQSTGQQIADVAQGGEFSGERLAADVALGTLFNRPTRLGRKLGMSEGPQEGPVQKLDLEEARTRIGQQIDAERVAAEPARIEPAQPKEEGDWWKSSTEPNADFINEKAARFKVDEFGNTIDALAKEPNANDVAQTPEQVPDFIQNKYGESLQSAYESISKINETSNKLISGLAEEQMGEIQRSLARKKEAETLGFRDILPSANNAAQDIYDNLSSRLQREGEGARITQSDIDAAAKIAARRNLTIELDRPFTGSTEIRGMWLSDPETGNRIVRVNPLMATRDTAIHEIGHDVFQGVTNPSMRKSLLESAQDTPAYKSELLARNAEVQEGKLTPKKAQEIALEEGLIQAFGEQIPNIQRSEIRSWFNAFKASTKQLITGKVSPEDAIAWMHYATTESVPWKGVTAPKATEQRTQRGGIDDTAYLKAVESGDNKAAQQMVDKAAKEAGYDTALWHGTDKNFNVFKTENGAFFALDKNTANIFGNTRKYYVDLGKNAEVAKSSEIGKREIKSLKDLGYTSASGEISGIGGKEFVVFDPSQIKSAEAITRDNSGNVIPLSERFNKQSSDIRYQRAQQETPEFKNWFGESKVVDADGKPLTVYHGTRSPEDFNTFRTNSGHNYGPGAYFTPEARRASGYAGENEGVRVYSTYVKVEKPYIVQSDATVQDLGYKLRQDPANDALMQSLVQRYGDKNNVGNADVGNAWLRSQGYDGIIKQRNRYTENGYVPEVVEVVAFNPEQIKSATGNRGTFDPSNPDIRYQRPEEKTRKFAGRVAEAESVPEEVRQTVRQSPESQYEQQNVKEVRDEASSMSMTQLAADMADTGSNTRVASGMETYSRQINSGDMASASNTVLSLAKSGTTWGQLINQFKILNSSTPEGLVRLVQLSLANKKRSPLTQQQAGVLMDGANRLKLASDEVLAAGRVARDAFAANDVAAINQSIKQLDLADAKRSEIDVILNESIARINPADAADLFISMVQGSVMGPISIVRNVVGNAINYPLRELGDAGAALIDATFSKDKNNSFNIRARTVDRIDAIGRSLPSVAKTLLKGSNAMPYELGTDSGNPLNFQRAWRRISEDLAAGKIGSALSPRNLTEATIGILPDIMLRLTQATDIPFRQAERARIISEIGRTKGLSEAQIQIAVRDPKLAFVTDVEAQRGRRGFTEDDLATIETESLKSIFQQDNKATKAVSGINRFIKNELGSTGYIPYRLISLFQKTPINVAAEALQFTPAGALQDWSKMTPRERNIAASRIAVGAMVTTAFGYLYHKGVITPNLDTAGETNKARELAKAGGVMPPGTINLSAVKRLVGGGKTEFQGGDTVVDLSSLGTAGALGIMAGTALRQSERGRTNEDLLTSVFKGVPTSGLNFVMEQQFLKGTSDFIKLLSQESSNSMDRWLKNLAVTAATPIAPAILGAVRRAERDKLPAMGGQSFIKDTVDELNQRYAALGLAIPGVKDPNAMPVRRDLWGSAVEQTPKGSNPWVYQFFNAWKARDIDADPLNTSIYSIWRRTADNTAIPSVPSPSLTWKQKTYDRMSPEQYDRYTELVGNYRRLRAEQEFMKPRFQQGGDERKLKLLQRAYDDGLLIAKKQFVRELVQSGQTLTPIAARRGFQQPSE